jgi:hypothetical protein
VPRLRHPRTFWVYIIWGESGSFAELPDVKGGQLVTVNNMPDADLVTVTQQAMSAVPPDHWLRITDR